MKEEELKKVVKEKYGKIAQQTGGGKSSCCSSSCCGPQQTTQFSVRIIIAGRDTILMLT